MASLITKSLYVNFASCPRAFYYAKYHPEAMDTDSDYAKSLIDKGIIVGRIAHKYFPDTVKVKVSEKDVNIELQLETTRKLLASNVNAISEASFLYKDLFCAVDLLKKDGDGWAIYEVKASSSSEKDKYYPDVAFQKYVLEKCGVKVNHFYLMHLNKIYVRQGDLNIQQLLIADSYKYDEKFINEEKKIDANLDDIRRLLNNHKLPDYGERCSKKCPFFKFCHQDLPTPNILSINGFQAKKAHEYIKQGIITMKDAIKKGIDLRDNARKTIQVKVNVSGVSPYVDKIKLKEFLQELHYPLYHLDFETYAEPIPPFDGAHPYQVVPFQYSLHIEKSPGGECEHKEFLADKMDSRRELAEQLCHDIPLDVTSIAFNAMFERGVITHLAEDFPDLKGHLLNIRDHIVDLVIPFKQAIYYDIKQGGSNSIKYVMPALCPKLEDAYHNLPFVHNGGEAMTEFPRMMEMEKNEEYQRKRKGMLMYCGLDTQSMVEILKVLWAAIK